MNVHTSNISAETLIAFAERPSYWSKFLCQLYRLISCVLIISALQNNFIQNGHIFNAVADLRVKPAVSTQRVNPLTPIKSPSFISRYPRTPGGKKRPQTDNRKLQLLICRCGGVPVYFLL